MLKSRFDALASLDCSEGIVQQVANSAVASCSFALGASRMQNQSHFEINRACESLFLQSG
jgi:hypothetical protein